MRSPAFGPLKDEVTAWALVFHDAEARVVIVSDDLNILFDPISVFAEPHKTFGVRFITWIELIRARALSDNLSIPRDSE